MSPNRLVPPATSPIGKLGLPTLSPVLSKTGVPIYLIDDPSSDVLKIELIFDAGSRNQSTPFQAQATSTMLTEGTLTRSSAQIANDLDYYGAYLQPRFGIDDSSLILYCIPEHLSSCTDVVNDILKNTHFPDIELDTQKRNAIQRLKVNESKGTYLARRAFYAEVFGPDNCYGNSVNQLVIDNISRETLLSFYQSHYLVGVKYVLVSGRIGPNTQAEIINLISALSKNNQVQNTIITKSGVPKTIKVKKADAVQTTIRIGKYFIGRSHEDYRRVQFLNLILGGYFGSRLMTNIREEKGLTYGIYSVVESYRDAASFYIETEINDDLAQIGVKEILSEIRRLGTELVPAKEIETAANYMIGSFLRSFDGPFSIADRYKTLIDFGFNETYYDEFIEIIRSTNALDLQELANRYFAEETLTTILVGKN